MHKMGSKTPPIHVSPQNRVLSGLSKNIKRAANLVSKIIPLPMTITTTNAIPSVHIDSSGRRKEGRNGRPEIISPRANSAVANFFFPLALPPYLPFRVRPSSDRSNHRVSIWRHLCFLPLWESGLVVARLTYLRQMLALLRRSQTDQLDRWAFSKFFLVFRYQNMFKQRARERLFDWQIWKK